MVTLIPKNSMNMVMNYLGVDGKMTIDEHIEQLKKLKSFHNGSYGSSIHFAIDTMRKHQKIEEILDQLIDSKIRTYDAVTEIEDIVYGEAEVGNGNDWSEEHKARDMAIKALEKDEPRTVHYEGDGYADGEMVYDMALCPNCEHVFEEDSENWECDFCPSCGQRLRW